MLSSHSRPTQTTSSAHAATAPSTWSTGNITRSGSFQKTILSRDNFLITTHSPFKFCLCFSSIIVSECMCLQQQVCRLSIEDVRVRAQVTSKSILFPLSFPQIDADISLLYTYILFVCFLEPSTCPSCSVLFSLVQVPFGLWTNNWICKFLNI